MFEQLRNEALEAAKVRRAAIAKLEADRMLSQEGKIKAFGEAEAAYRGTINRLQDRARREFERRRASLPDELEAARGKRARAMRDTLGSEVYFALLSRWVDRVSPGEMMQMIKDASDDFTQLALIELVESSLYGRDDQASMRAKHDLAEMEAYSPYGRDVVRLQAEAKQLENAEVEVAKLDVEQVRQDMADRYHLRVQDVPEGTVA